MTHEGWKQMIRKAVEEEKNGDSSRLENLAEEMYQMDEARQVLSDKGWRWIGLSLLKSVQSLPDNWLPK